MGAGSLDGHPLDGSCYLQTNKVLQITGQPYFGTAPLMSLDDVSTTRGNAFKLREGQGPLDS
jgi:hypothetical protein